MAFLDGHKANFEMLKKVFAAGDAALVECQIAATGEVVAAICATTKNEDNVNIVPFALLFNDNPYAILNPPNADGGFITKENEGAELTDKPRS